MSEPFRKSNRYPRLLKFIVEQTLAGNADLLKERSLGIEVFDRPPDYELRTDPIVRVAAGELRKRLAQYYVQSSCEKELRIELQPGSYVLEFRWPQYNSSHATVPLPEPVDPTALTVTGKAPGRYYKRPWIVAGALLLLIASAAVFVIG